MRNDRVVKNERYSAAGQNEQTHNGAMEIKDGLQVEYEEDGILFCNGITTDSFGDKQKKLSIFARQKIFLQMICDEKSNKYILLIGILFAILSGISMSSVIVFAGRIKHILLTHEPKATSFLQGTYEQVFLLAVVTAFTIVTNFAMHMSTTVLGDKINCRLERRCDGMRARICNQLQQLSNEISAEMIAEKIALIEKGSSSLEMLSRSAATIISSLIICFCHEARLTMVTMGVIPLSITLDVLSKRLSKKSDALLTSKFSQATQMEKEMLLLKDTNNYIANDGRLLRLSSELRNCTRHAILHQVWKSSYAGMLCFLVFTFVGCGMLYGGYILDEDSTVEEGDVFIVVLSVAHIALSIAGTTNEYKTLRKGVNAATFIRSIENFEYGLLQLSHDNNRRCSMNDVTVTVHGVPEFKQPIKAVAKNLIARFISGTKSVLHNYHNHKLFLFLGLFLAIIHGLEQPAYNVVMGRVFLAMLAERPNIRELIHCAIQFSAVGFCVFLSRTASAILVTVASEHMAVSFRVILARHLLRKIGKRSFNKLEIDSLVDENLSLTAEAKSLYYPHASELIARLTSMIINIILGFIFSWEIALLGAIFTVLCFLAQIEMEFKMITKCCGCSDSQRIKNNDVLKPYKEYIFKAMNFSIIQTSGYALKTICYALTAYICHHGYKHQAKAFLSVITMFSAIRDAVHLPELFAELCKSWKAVHRIFACMYGKPSRSNVSSVSESIRL